MENAGQSAFEEMQTLFTVQQRITSHLDTQVVVQLIADGARQLIRCQGAVVSLLDGEDLRVAAASDGHGPGRGADRVPPAGQGFAGRPGRPHGQSLPLPGCCHGRACRPGVRAALRHALLFERPADL